ncbi:MAG: EamA family transporter [Hyphomicrobiales bacterium]|nr:MAG: EamA family transporter [Hyphomicrobiales bacterium]
MSARQWLLLLLLSLIWGGSFFFVEVALRGLPVLTIVLGRVGLAALVLHVAVRAAGLAMPGGAKLWAGFFVLGGLNNFIPFSLIVWAQSHLTSGLASILNATTPFFTVMLAHMLTVDEKMSAGKLLGVLVGLIGVAVMIGIDALSGLAGEVWPQIAVLGAAGSYALAGIFGRRFRALSPMVVATGQVSASTIMLAPLVLLVDAPWRLAWPAPEVWGAVLALAVVCTALAYWIYFRLLASAGATNLLLVTMLIPVSAIWLGAGFLGEALSLHQIGGMATIALGLLIMDGRAARRLRRWLAAPQV